MCSFCFYRKANTKCPRYRKDPEEVAEMAQALENSGVRLVDLTMGENVMIHDGKRYDLLVKLVRAVCDRVDIAIMISPGVLPRKMLKSLKDVGADSYALYQETHNKALFSTLRLDQGYDERMKAKIEARKEGLLIEEGILLGVGETNEDRMDSIFAMSRLGVSQVRAMGFLLFIFLIANTAPVTNLIKADMIKENTLISAPAIPLGLTRAALRRAGRNLVHDPLQLGVATMGVEACAN
jgi:methylornithine synthase